MVEGRASRHDVKSVLYLIDDPEATLVVERVLRVVDGPTGDLPPALHSEAAALRGVLARVLALEYAGFRCHLAEANGQAIVQAVQLRAALVVLDVAKYNTALQRLHSDFRTDPDTRQIPLVVMTDDQRARAGATKVGCEAYLARSAKPTVFFEEIRRVALGAVPHVP